MREWQYWTRNKLQILAGYLPAFNTASTRSNERIYIDLMAGQPFNRDKVTGEDFDGSARLALSASPGFTRLAFCEQEPNASHLRADLGDRYPGRHFNVYSGDCNETIDQVLHGLLPYRWAPTFAFVDQQAAEVRWETLGKLARFRSGKRKTELWILASPSMITKGVAGTNGAEFAAQVDLLYGTTDWRRIQEARRSESITAEEYRDEMVNLLRWRLETVLGYAATARIPMRLPTNLPIYDMVFATDHEVGTRIMNHLYRKAAEREPEMVAEARDRAARERAEKAGRFALFEIASPVIPIEKLAWEPMPCWDPTSRSWW